MIDDILAFSRAGQGVLKPRDIPLGELVERVWGGLDLSGVDASLEADDLPIVRADESQLLQVMQNLIANAIKFRRPETSVTVVVTGAVVDGQWLIKVADNGIGIEEQYRSRIFRMFQRLHTTDRYVGSGIGLSIAEQIVHRHGGRIGVESNSTGGSTFWFTLPVQGVPDY